MTPPVLTAGPRTARRSSQLVRTARCACMICQLRRPSSLTPERTTPHRAWPLPHPAPSLSRTRSTPRCGIPPRHASLPRRSALLRACVTRRCALSARRTGGYARHTPSWITRNALSPRTPLPSTLLLTSRPSLKYTADSRLYCGFENAIEVFDVSSPGYDMGDRLKLGLTRKEKGGQRGERYTPPSS